MRGLIASGELGALGMIASWNYTNYLYRPRRPEELDTSKGGGILFNQVPHQIDTVRLLGGGLVQKRARPGRRARSGAADRGATAPPSWSSPNGVAASLVYSGYDFFDSDELHFWISERGAPKQPAHGAARRALARAQGTPKARCAPRASPTAARTRASRRISRISASRSRPARAATCAPPRTACFVYGEDGQRELALPDGGKYSGRHNVLDDMRDAILSGRKPTHDGRWGKATLEVALAIQQLGARAAGNNAGASGGGGGRELMCPKRRVGAPSPACGGGRGSD